MRKLYKVALNSHDRWRIRRKKILRDYRSGKTLYRDPNWPHGKMRWSKKFNKFVHI